MPDDSGTADLTVGRAAALAGVTVRTLHHWDDIGLARPSARSSAGYRVYTDVDQERLRPIVVYRELGLGLDAIRRLLDDPATDILTALRTQQGELAARIARLTALQADLERMVSAHERGLMLSEGEQRAVFGPDWNPAWPLDARRRWGDTVQWQQYAERSAARDAGEWQAVADAMREVESALATAMDAGAAPGTADADALVERHRAVFSAYFPLTREMQVILGRLFTTDPGYAAHYDGIRPGLAEWFRRSIEAEARRHGVDPESATWR